MKCLFLVGIILIQVTCLTKELEQKLLRKEGKILDNKSKETEKSRHINLLAKKIARYTAKNKNNSLYLSQKEESNAKCTDKEFPLFIRETNVCVSACPKEKYIYLIKEINECVSTCPTEKYKFSYKNICVENCPEKTVEVNSNCEPNSIDEIVNNIDSYILNLWKNKPLGSFDNSTYQIYEYPKEENNSPSSMSNISTIDFSKCEEKLREEEVIPTKENFIVFMVDIAREDRVVSQVEYSLYRIDGTKIDLSFCNKSDTVIITTPINSKNISQLNFSEAAKIAEWGYDMFNPSDKFYNDVCSRYTTEHGTDIIIEDRKTEIYVNLSLCEKNCEYVKMDLEKYQVSCKCQIKTKISLEESETLLSYFNTDFQEIKLNSNIRIFNCASLVFNLSLFIKNQGGWMIVCLGVIEIVIIIIYIATGLGKLKERVSLLIQKKTLTVDKIFKVIPTDEACLNTSKPEKGPKSSTETNYSNPSPPNRLTKRALMVRRSHKITKGQLKNMDDKTQSTSTAMVRRSSQRRSTKKLVSEALRLSKVNKIEKGLIKSNLQRSKTDVIQYKLDKQEKDARLQRLPTVNHKDLTDEDYNVMSYREAFFYDKRHFCRYYLSILKIKQKFIFCFITSTDLNIRLVKIAMFFFNISLSMTLNTLFYSDRSMTLNYKNKGKYSFCFEIKKIIFASLATGIINFLLGFVFLADMTVHDFDKEEDIEKARNLRMNFIKCTRVKNIIYFIFVIALMFLEWYYISAFCSVYKNTQLHLIINICITFILNMLFPFALCFFIGVCRMWGLKGKHRWMYIISKVLQLF